MSISDAHQSTLNHIQEYKYWSVIETVLESYDEEDYLSSVEDIITSCEERVEKQAKAEGKNVSQVKRHAVGSLFQSFMYFSIHKTAEENGYHALFEPDMGEIESRVGAQIDVQDSTLEPDMDIVLHAPSHDKPLYIFSCKTSLRDRIAQSAMWKLFFEMASHDCPADTCPTHRYEVSSPIETPIRHGFITLDFYDEVQGNSVSNLLDSVYKPGGGPGEKTYPLTELHSHIESGWENC